MKRAWIALVIVLLLTAVCAVGACETLYVDNRETDKIYPERLNMRDEPAKTGGILGLYYTGAQVEVLAEENDDYAKIILYTVAYFDNHFFCGAEQIMRKTTDDLSSKRALVEAFSKVLEGDFDLATWKETVNRILDENNCIRLDNKAINIFLENHIFSRKKSKEKRAKLEKA